jgi:hypothetical protein
MTAVALVTHSGLPDLSDDDRLLVPALQAVGVQATAAVWDDPRVDWSRFDTIVLRSPWDYHLRPDDFLDWIARLEAAGASLWNRPRVVLWNADKTYLRDLAGRGVDVVPTHWVDPGDPTTLETLLARTGWDQVVIKPSISASAHNTWRTSVKRAAEDETRFRQMVDRQRSMVQPYLDIVESEGEWSLFFFGGRYSHAVIKRPRPGDFRVQHELGGVYRRREPSPLVIEQAEQALTSAPEPTLYGRVDGFEIDGRLLLLELELLEPSMGLLHDAAAPARFAKAIAALGGNG